MQNHRTVQAEIPMAPKFLALHIPQREYHKWNTLFLKYYEIYKNYSYYNHKDGVEIFYNSLMFLRGHYFNKFSADEIDVFINAFIYYLYDYEQVNKAEDRGLYKEYISFILSHI